MTNKLVETECKVAANRYLISVHTAGNIDGNMPAEQSYQSLIGDYKYFDHQIGNSVVQRYPNPDTFHSIHGVSHFSSLKDVIERWQTAALELAFVQGNQQVINTILGR